MMSGLQPAAWLKGLAARMLITDRFEQLFPLTFIRKFDDIYPTETGWVRLLHFENMYDDESNR